jgi:hypothetical protein
MYYNSLSVTYAPFNQKVVSHWHDSQDPIPEVEVAGTVFFSGPATYRNGSENDAASIK